MCNNIVRWKTALTLLVFELFVGIKKLRRLGKGDDSKHLLLEVGGAEAELFISSASIIWLNKKIL